MVEKSLGQKKCEKIYVKNFLVQKIFGPENIWAKRGSVKKCGLQILSPPMKLSQKSLFKIGSVITEIFMMSPGHMLPGQMST